MGMWRRCWPSSRLIRTGVLVGEVEVVLEVGVPLLLPLGMVEVECRVTILPLHPNPHRSGDHARPAEAVAAEEAAPADGNNPPTPDGNPAPPPPQPPYPPPPNGKHPSHLHPRPPHQAARTPVPHHPRVLRPDRRRPGEHPLRRPFRSGSLRLPWRNRRLPPLRFRPGLLHRFRTVSLLLLRGCLPSRVGGRSRLMGGCGTGWVGAL
mmetsp:Transcript_55513/g.66944  ORF Transcript_55513/g.66944 Transcript_55513/m.66944 type:complete len:207 (+) Transcript_55513:1263-1883(+)